MARTKQVARLTMGPPLVRRKPIVPQVPAKRVRSPSPSSDESAEEESPPAKRKRGADKDLEDGNEVRLCSITYVFSRLFMFLDVSRVQSEESVPLSSGPLTRSAARKLKAATETASKKVRPPRRNCIVLLTAPLILCRAPQRRPAHRKGRHRKRPKRVPAR